MNAPVADAPVWSAQALEGLRLVVAGGCGGIGRELVAQALRLSFVNKCDAAEQPLVGEYYQRCFDAELVPSGPGA